jgi:drug/metabolite transporter (DMT)-like permease
VGFAYMGGAILVYGSMWPVFRFAVAGISPLWFGTLRMFSAALVCVLLLALLGRLKLPNRQDIPAVLSVGIFMMGLFVCLTHTGLVHVGAGRASLLAYTTPLWVTPAAVLLLGERLTKRKLLGLALALGGLVTLFNPFGFDWSARDVVIGNAVTILHMRVHRFRLTPFQLAPWQLFVAGVITLAAALVFEPDPTIPWTAETALLVAYSGPFGSTVSMWAVTSAGRYLPATTLSVGMLGSPVLALALAAIFLGEGVTVSLFAGFVAILGGLALVSLGGRPRETT